jgi:large subunit ribosomal protein L17
VEKERIKTTVPKAKYVRPLIEKAITVGKQGNIHARRLLLARYSNKKTVDKIINTLSPRFKDRTGGYTRIIKLGFRPGDQAPLAYLEFVDYNTQIISTTKKEKTAKQKKETKAKKEEKPEEQKNITSEKKASSEKKPSGNKKQNKQAAAKLDKKRKKARQQQKKSRRINR